MRKGNTKVFPFHLKKPSLEIPLIIQLLPLPDKAISSLRFFVAKGKYKSMSLPPQKTKPGNPAYYPTFTTV
jgi:hypothetical protein